MQKPIDVGLVLVWCKRLHSSKLGGDPRVNVPGAREQRPGHTVSLNDLYRTRCQSVCYVPEILKVDGYDIISDTSLAFFFFFDLIGFNL